MITENIKIDKVINLILDDKISKKRLMARRVCENCKTDYNMLFKPPKVEGICDVCGGKVIRRKDDTENAIQERLDAFHSETAPVIELLKKLALVADINADQSVEKIQTEIISALGL